MAIIIDETWEATAVLLPGGEIKGFRKKGIELVADREWIRSHLAHVHSQGGLVFRQEEEPADMQPVFLPGGRTCFQSSPPSSNIWYLPEGNFGTSVELAMYFGFPAILPLGDECREKLTAFLLEMQQRYSVAVVDISGEALLIESVKSDVSFSVADMERLKSLNEHYFGVSHSKGFWRDLLRQYRLKGFFVLGKV